MDPETLPRSSLTTKNDPRTLILCSLWSAPVTDGLFSQSGLLYAVLTRTAQFWSRICCQNLLPAGIDRLRKNCLTQLRLEGRLGYEVDSTSQNVL